MTQDGKFDDLFTHIAGSAGGIEPLLDEFFGFLHRKSDFYVQFHPEKGNVYKMGFPEGDAEKMLLKSFRKYSFTDVEKESPQQPSTPDQSKAFKSEQSYKSQTTSPPQSELLSTKSNNVVDTTLKQLPIGNGGIGPNYFWTQTLKDLTVYVDVPPSTRGKDMKCVITTRKLYLAHNNVVLLEGPLEDAVSIDDSVWTISNSLQSSNAQVVISLEKCKKTWWKHVIEGHPEIDTTKVTFIFHLIVMSTIIKVVNYLQVDSTQNISEYDEETQAAIRKIVHEQRHKVL